MDVDTFEEKSVNACKFCGKFCKNQNSLRNHERLCSKNPDRQISPIIEYNRKVKNGDISCSNQFIKAKLLGLPKPVVSEETKRKLSEKSRKFRHTDETKKRISESMKRIYEGKSIWSTQLEHRKSYAEQYFDECFPELKQNYHVDRYYLDLANPDKKIYIEIDGEQHYNDEKVITHDIERTNRLGELGWTCLKRIRWSEYKKFSKEEQKSVIDFIKNNI